MDYVKAAFERVVTTLPDDASDWQEEIDDDELNHRLEQVMDQDEVNPYL